MTLKGVVNLLHVGGTEIPPTDPVIVSAISIADNVVRVYYDQVMRASDPGASDDALNPSNYNISTGVGVPRTASSVSVHSAVPTVVDVTLSGEMTDGAAYAVEVSNVRNTFGMLINPSHDTANFTGQGTTPSVDSATATSSSAVVVVFDEPMRDNAALVTPGNYNIGGYASVVVSGVTKNSSTQVTLTVEKTMKTGETYNLTVSNVQDEAWNPIAAPGNTKSFTGVGDHPQLLSTATPIDSENVRIQFSKDVVGLEGSDPDNYEINGGALAIVSILQETGDTFKITTAEQTTGLLYTITVFEPGAPPPPDGIHDFYGNEVLAPNNTATFLGIGVSPPEIEIEPVNEAHDIDVRAPLRVRFWDVEDEFSGIDLSSVWVRVLYEDYVGASQSFYCVKSGLLQPQVVGEVSGDPLDADGVAYSVLPRIGHWQANTTYTVQAYAQDVEGSSNLEQQTFRTGDAGCFEDLGLQPETIDIQIAQTLPFENLEKLRNAIMRNCTSSADTNVQARTLLYLASMTDLRTLLARYVDFSLVDNVRLCDRRPVLDVHAALLRYSGAVASGLREIPNLSSEGRKLLERYTASRSTVYVVNAIATAVVLAVVKQDE